MQYGFGVPPHAVVGLSASGGRQQTQPKSIRRWHKNRWYIQYILGCPPFPVIVTTRISTFQAVDPYSFATISSEEGKSQ